MARIICGGKARLLTRSLVPWYRAGGCPAPIAVWQPKAGNGWNPTTIAESYVNRVNPGTYNAAPGTAPAWAAATGWTFTAASVQWLRTSLVPAATYSAVIRFSGIAATAILFGLSIAAQNKRFVLTAWSGVNRTYGYGNVNKTFVGTVAAGTMGLCAGAAYLNGALDGATGGTWTNTTAQVLIGGYNAADPGPTLGSAFTGVITAIAVWSVDVSAYQSAIHAALVAAGL